MNLKKFTILYDRQGTIYHIFSSNTKYIVHLIKLQATPEINPHLHIPFVKESCCQAAKRVSTCSNRHLGSSYLSHRGFLSHFLPVILPADIQQSGNGQDGVHRPGGLSSKSRRHAYRPSNYPDALIACLGEAAPPRDFSPFVKRARETKGRERRGKRQEETRC